MKKDLGVSLKNEKIQSVMRRTVLSIEGKTPLQECFQKMVEARIGCAVIIEKGRLIGIFTERDIMTRVIEPGLDLSTPVERVMTTKPKSLQIQHSVADAIRVMNRGSYRHIPLTNEKGEVVGILTAKDLIKYLAEHFPYEVYNLPPDPHQVQRAPEGA